jgi:hypothetical protein
MKRNAILIALSLCFIVISDPSAAVFTVTTTVDAGPGSLRDAITLANGSPGPDLIDFNIVPPGPHTIFPLSQLPPLTDLAGVNIDGITQPGGADCGPSPPSTATLLIEIDGASAGPSHGLWIASDNNIISGLVINNFELDGIRIEGGAFLEPTASFNFIHCCFIGTDPSGSIDRGNGTAGGSLWAGIRISQVPGGSAFENFIDGNLVSGNWADGICILGPQVPGDVFSNHLLNNYIGTDITGTVDLGNDHEGVCLAEGTHDNDLQNNLISGNDFDGVGIQGFNNLGFPAPPIQTYRNIITGNIIGLDINLNPLPNKLHGVAVGEYGPGQWGCADQNQIGPDNIIAFNGRDGVSVWEDGVNTTNADNNLITQNSIYDNVELGIDLDNNGVTVNDPGDPDVLANQDMNFPIITSANESGGSTNIAGTCELSAATVEVFKAALDPTGYGEGMVYLGDAVLDGGGGWTFVDLTLVGGDLVTTTATDGADNTSEFSEDFPVTTVSCCVLRTADVDVTGTFPTEVDLSDLGLMVDFLFKPPGSVILPCVPEADVDALGGVNPVDLSDLGILVDFLFKPPGSVTLPLCPP